MKLSELSFSDLAAIETHLKETRNLIKHRIKVALEYRKSNGKTAEEWLEIEQDIVIKTNAVNWAFVQKLENDIEL